jgi:hypothetical protein
MNNNTIDLYDVIKVTSKEFNHEFIGTKANAKRFYLREALAERNTDTTYAADIRRFTVEQLIWFVFGKDNFTVEYRKNSKSIFNKGEWCKYNFTYEDLIDQEHVWGNCFRNNTM